MKLDREQIEVIERYILDSEIRNKYFYEEILDHYCSLVEAKMEQGIDFHNAYADVSYLFAHIEEPFGLFGKFPKYGFQALEQRYLKQERKAVIKQILLFFMSRKGLIWLLGSIFLLFVSQVIPYAKLLVASVLLLNVVILAYDSVKRWTWKQTALKSRSVIKTRELSDIEVIKAGQLSSITLESTILFYSFLPMQLPNLIEGFIETDGADKLLIWLISGLLFLPVSWVVAKRERRKMLNLSEL